VRLAGFIIKIYHDARSAERQILLITFFAYGILKLSMIVVHESHVMRAATATFLTFLEIWADDGIERNFTAVFCVRPLQI